MKNKEKKKKILYHNTENYLSNAEFHHEKERVHKMRRKERKRKVDNDLGCTQSAESCSIKEREGDNVHNLMPEKSSKKERKVEKFGKSKQVDLGHIKCEVSEDDGDEIVQYSEGVLSDNRKHKRRREKKWSTDLNSKKRKHADDDKCFLRMSRKMPQVDLKHENSDGYKNGHHHSVKDTHKNNAFDPCDNSPVDEKPVDEKIRRKKRKKKVRTSRDLQNLQDKVDSGDHGINKLYHTSDEIKDEGIREISVTHENAGKIPEDTEECIVKKKNRKRKHLTQITVISESQNFLTSVDSEKNQFLENESKINMSTQNKVDSKSERERKSMVAHENVGKVSEDCEECVVKKKKRKRKHLTDENGALDLSDNSPKFVKEASNENARLKKRKKKVRSRHDLQNLQDGVDNGDRTSEANASDEIKGEIKREISVAHENVGSVSEDTEECIKKKKRKRKHLTDENDGRDSCGNTPKFAKEAFNDRARLKKQKKKIKKSSNLQNLQDEVNSGDHTSEADTAGEKKDEKKGELSVTHENVVRVIEDTEECVVQKKKKKKKKKKKHLTQAAEIPESQNFLTPVDSEQTQFLENDPRIKMSTQSSESEKKRNIMVALENVGKVSDDAEECVVKKKKRKKKHLTQAAEIPESQNFLTPVDSEKMSPQTSEASESAQDVILKTSTDTDEMKSRQNMSKSLEKAEKERKNAQAPDSDPSRNFNDPTNNDSCETESGCTSKRDNLEFVGFGTGDLKDRPSSGIDWSISNSYDDDEDTSWMEDLPFDPRSQMIPFDLRCTICREGTVLKKGKWDGIEDNILRKTVSDFCEKYGIEDATPLVLPKLYSDSRKIRSFNQATKFYLKICKGLRRLPFDVYIRARKIFDDRNYKGRFTNEEDKTLKHLKKIYGNKWSQIGFQMDRSGQSVLDRYRVTLKEGMVKGRWSKKEKKQLIKAVVAVTGCEDYDELAKQIGISWVRVQQMVPTRTPMQCALMWKHNLCWNFGDRQKHVWTAADSIELIESIYGLEINEEFDIDWLTLQKKFQERSPTYSKLIDKWTALKMRYLTNYRFMTFEDILEELYHKALPKLRERAKRLQMSKERIKSKEFISDSEDSSDSDELS